MTRNKAQKRAIRARMVKTGERYTTARHHHLGLHHDTADEPAPDAVAVLEPAPPKPAGLPPRIADPGMSDEAIERATGKGWDDWFAILDQWGAAERTHTEIARHLWEEQGVDGWWAQAVTAGYERARGMRARHQRADGAFTVNASTTVAVPVDRLFAAFADEAIRDRWLDPGELRLRTAQPNRSARFDVVANDTRLNANFIAKGDTKASVQLQHERLPVAGDVEVWRARWRERLNRLVDLLAAER